MFRTDANLRPEGRSGPLTRSLESYASYYDGWARTWELQALIKARPVAGDDGIGLRFAELVLPHVWSASLDPELSPVTMRGAAPEVGSTLNAAVGA